MYAKSLIRFINSVAIVGLVSLAACTTKKGTDVSIEQANQPDLAADTSNPGIDTSYDNSNLFDVTTSSDEQPTTTTSSNTTTTVSQQQQYCLNPYSNMGLGATSAGLPPWYGQNIAGLNQACVDSSFNDDITGDTLLDWGLDSFGAMQSCYETVMARGPQACSAGMDATMIFKMSQMAMVRCFRNIVRQQAALVNWAPEQDQSYQNTDNSLFLLLQLFSQE